MLDRVGRGKALESILSARHDLSLSCSTLRMVCNVLVVTAFSYYFHVKFEGDHSPAKIFWLAILVSVPSLLIFSVAIPQAWAKYAGELLIALTWPLIRTVHWTLYPAVAAMNLVDELIRRLAGVSMGDDPDTEAQQVQDEIMSVVEEGTAEGAVDEEQKKMIEGVISFRDLQVGQIMTPRTEIIAVDVHSPLSEVRDKILRDGLSRVPVYEGNLDNIIGLLYAKDLLKEVGHAGEAVDLRKMMRPALFVPRTKPLRDLLREFKAQQVHMAIVLDEFGGTSGLVTTEDIVEEIIGNIADEFERPAPAELRRIDERTVEVDAKMSIAELNRTLDITLPEDQDFHTIGGFVISALGAIPAKGERLTHEGIGITVMESEPRRVKKLKLELPERNAVGEPQAEAALG
jgi:putative hemolysin